MLSVVMLWLAFSVDCIQVQKRICIYTVNILELGTCTTHAPSFLEKKCSLFLKNINILVMLQSKHHFHHQMRLFITRKTEISFFNFSSGRFGMYRYYWFVCFLCPCLYAIMAEVTDHHFCFSISWPTCIYANSTLPRNL